MGKIAGMTAKAKRCAGLLILLTISFLSVSLHARDSTDQRLAAADASEEGSVEPASATTKTLFQEGQSTNIVQEQPGGVAERAYLHYENPEVAMKSYAAVDIGGCSGTMIGPDVMMTAGHCGGPGKTATFRLYTAANTQMTESFACQYLLTTWPDTDLQLYWCSPNSAGEHAGDKFGYADFDIVIDPTSGFDYNDSRSLINLNTALYSIWMNPIDSLDPGWYSIYSEGKIDNLNYSSWYTPNQATTPNYLCGNSGCIGGSTPDQNCDTGACGQPCSGGTCTARASQALGLHTDLWSMGGASGSSQLREATNRILVGPLSVGAPDARGRSSMGIADYLYWAITDPNVSNAGCAPCVGDQLNRPLLSSLGIANPAAYYGWTDGTLDGVFDVQGAIELIRGENSRDWYWLGFESNRRNRLWTRHAPAVVTFDTSDPATGTATLSTLGQTADAYVPALSHDRLNLQAGQVYRIGFTMYLFQSQANQPLRVCLEGTETHCSDTNPTTGSWLPHASHLRASTGAGLRFYLRGGTELLLAGVSLVTEAAQMTFDSHDKRVMWRNHNTGERGRIWPNGITSASSPDWCGAVYRDGSRPLNDDWSLRNRQLVIDGGANYRVCFQHRSSTRSPLSGSIQGTARLLNEFGLVAGSTLLFTPGSSWQQTCTEWLYLPTDDNNLQFGVQAAESSASGTYLVDGIQIERQASGIVYVDLGNQGFREEGTVSYPFSSVGEGAGAVAQSGELRIAAGSYPERLTIQRPMTLNATGGPVVIGQ